MVVAPGGRILAGPMHEQKGILYAEVDPTAVDVAGHYARPDIFTLTIDREPHPPATFTG